MRCTVKASELVKKLRYYHSKEIHIYYDIKFTHVLMWCDNGGETLTWWLELSVIITTSQSCWGGVVLHWKLLLIYELSRSVPPPPLFLKHYTQSHILVQENVYTRSVKMIFIVTIIIFQMKLDFQQYSTWNILVPTILSIVWNLFIIIYLLNIISHNSSCFASS